MANSWGLFEPDRSTPMNPIATPFLLLKTSIANALDRIYGQVDNATDRDAKFPNPVVGQRVFRKDRGFTEQWFTKFDNSTNPGGSTLGQGWYPVDGRLPMVRLWRTVGFNWATGAGFTVGWDSIRSNIGNAASVSGSDVTLNYGGRWQIDIQASMATAAGVNYGNLILGINGSREITSSLTPSSSATTSATLSTVRDLPANTTLQTILHSNVTQTGSTTNDGGQATFMSLAYLGPA